MKVQIDYHEAEPLTVWLDGKQQQCSLDETATTDSYWTLVLTVPDGRTWTGSGQGLWTAFVELRRQIEPLGYRLCCAGARTDAITRKGRDWNNDEVYLLTRRTLLGIQNRASMFDYAPPNTTGTVEQQETRYDQYLASPWWRARLPGDPVR